jgi:alkylation response protein AidB-like acyl-CoA dehydrogenase
MSTATELPGLTETQRQVVELAREFAREKIEPFAAEWDRTSHFPRDVIDEMGKLGFLGMTTPEEYDGMGLDTVTYLLALEEIAAADSSIAVSMGIHNAIPTTMLVKHGTPQQKERWLKPMARGELLAGFALSEAEAGSDAASLAAQATREKQGWVLNGAKAWATNAGTADLMMIMARTDQQGARRGAKGISTFIVPPDPRG